MTTSEKVNHNWYSQITLCLYIYPVTLGKSAGVIFEVQTSEISPNANITFTIYPPNDNGYAPVYQVLFYVARAAEPEFYQ
jgi:hypothetical protein